MEDLMDLDAMDFGFEEESENVFADFPGLDEEDDQEVETTFEPVTPKRQPARPMASPANKPLRPAATKPQPAAKPVAKPAPKVAATVEVKAPKPKAAKPEPAKKGMVRVNQPSKAVSYEEIFQSVTAKVEKYDQIMQERANGGKTIPQSVVISKELLVSLLAARFTEEQTSGLKLAMAKSMISMGFDKEEVVAALSDYQVKKVEAEAIYAMFMQVMYEVLYAGAGVPMFKTEDCNCTLKGNWTEATVKDNAHLQTEYATYTDSFLRITASSPAPANKKTLGHIKGDSFVPAKIEK